MPLVSIDIGRSDCSRGRAFRNLNIINGLYHSSFEEGTFRFASDLLTGRFDDLRDSSFG